MPPHMDVDVAIAGGSLAGCAAAHRLAREGLRVAVVEKHSDPRAYKTTCNHFIVASAVPTFDRLGLTDEIEAAGGVPNSIAIWSRYGWIHADPPADHPYPRTGYNITRERLDPMVRELAAGTDGVDLLLGHTATDLEWHRGRVRGVRVRAGQREIAEYEPQPVAEPPLQLLDDPMGLAAVGALIVAVLHQRHRRRGRALDVVALAHRQGAGDRKRRAVVCSIMTSPPAARVPLAGLGCHSPPG